MDQSSEHKPSREEVLGEDLNRIFQENGLSIEEQEFIRQVLREWDNDPGWSLSLKKVGDFSHKNNIIRALSTVIQIYFIRTKD
jgi:hypothetical protein